MDKRDYNEPNDCGLGRCECSEDDKCGCTYPNNISQISCPENINCEKEKTIHPRNSKKKFSTKK